MPWIGLRDEVAPPWEKVAGALFKNPWAARDDYIDVILDRSAENLEKFFARQATHPLTASEQATALKLLELQRQALLMYTSCGWFFDDLSGIETVQVIQFAARAVQLAEELFGDSFEEQFVERLARAESNLAEHGNGRDIYETMVRPARVDWERVGAHYAVSSLFAGYPAQAKVYCYRAEQKAFQAFTAGKAKLAVGRINLVSEITTESNALVFGALHMGDHNVNGGVRPFLGEEVEAYLAGELAEPFSRADFPEVIRLMDRRFGVSNYSLRSLFRDEQRQLLEWILASAVSETEILYRQIYEQRAPLLRFLKSIRIPLPKEFQNAAEFIVNKDLRRALEGEQVNQERVRDLVQAVKLEGTALDITTLEFAFRKNLERLAGQLGATPDVAALQKLHNAVSLIPDLPFSVNLWMVQNLYYQLSKTFYPTLRAQRQSDQAMITCIKELGKILGVKCD